MYNQIRVEFYKLWSSKFFYLSILGFIGLGVFMSYNNYVFWELDLTGQQAFIRAISENDFLFIIALLVSHFIGSDFTNRTITNEVRVGYSRTCVVLSRAIVLLPFAVLLYLFYAAPQVLVEGILNGFGGVIAVSDMLIRTILFAFHVMAITSFTALNVFWCKKASLGMIISFFFTLVTCNILSNFDDNIIYQATSFYLMTRVGWVMTTQELIFSFVSAAVTLMVVLFAACIVFRKAELK